MIGRGDAVQKPDKGAYLTRLSGAVARIPWLGPRLAIRLHRRGMGGGPTSWADLGLLVEAERPDIVSVDVFDTCLVRDLLGDQPIEDAIDRQPRPAFATVAGGVGPGPHDSRDSRAAAFERLLCHAVPGVAEALARIRRAGSQIVFLSDTDRSSSTLIGLLESEGLFVEGDRLVASCEADATKSSGKLFNETWSDRGDTTTIWHVGNNLWSDVTMANSAGLRAFQIAVADPTRYESAMAVRSESAGPAVAAAARTARLTIESRLAHGSASTGTQLEVLGAEVAGQAFGAFLLDVADQSRAAGIDQLWFLSRDGELLHEMAQAMPSDHWDGTSLGYLHCSRWSWLLAGATSHGFDNWLATGTADEKAFIHYDRHEVPLVSLLGRIGLQVSDLELTTLDPDRQLASLDPEVPLPHNMVDAWTQLLADPGIQAVIASRAEERHDLIIDYLQSLGLSQGRVGLVDVGWRGRLAWAMSAVVQEVTGHPPVHFHFGGNRVLGDVGLEADIRRFAFDGVVAPSPITNPVSCVETLTASGRARIVGYSRTDDGRVEPRLEREVAAVLNGDRKRLWAGALCTAAELPSRRLLDEVGATTDSLGREANSVLALWWTQPLRSEAEAMRGLAFEADDDGRMIRPLVRPYSPKEISAEEKLPRQWQQGSAALTRGPFRHVLNLYRTGQTWLGRRRSF